MICGLSLKKGRNITGLVVEDIVGELQCKQIKSLLHTTSLNSYRHCTLMDTPISKHYHSFKGISPPIESINTK